MPAAAIRRVWSSYASIPKNGPYGTPGRLLCVTFMSQSTLITLLAPVGVVFSPGTKYRWSPPPAALVVRVTCTACVPLATTDDCTVADPPAATPTSAHAGEPCPTRFPAANP